ncbi:flavin reductase [Endobacterium cereale]|nr:flavin reductase [Endobacterium cereale]MEB2844216.1 flavin reductase [Endobacterium cereale]
MQGQAISHAVENTEEARRVEYRDAMARLGAAVHIVTTSGAAGRAGFAATAVCSVSDSPPTLLVCLNKTSSAYWPVKGNGTLCVNVLADEHRELSRLFGGKTPVEERFAGASWTELPSGGLALDGALACFDCEIISVADGHSHDILICRVMETQMREGGKSLIYLDRDYRIV